MTRQGLLGVDFDPLTRDELNRRILESLDGGPRIRIEGLNVAKVIDAADNEHLMRALGEAEIVHLDGKGAYLGHRLLGGNAPPNTPGIELMFDIISTCERTGHSIFLLGATTEVIEGTVVNLRDSYPNLVIAGFRNGYFADQEESEIVSSVNLSKADVLLIGISSPRKELFLNRNWERLLAKVAMGVGGSFDVASGRLKRAPPWMQRAGIEWLYRLLQEPRRLGGRYLSTNAIFGWRVLGLAIRGGSRHLKSVA